MQEKNRQQLLDQYPTPAWVAEALVRQHFNDLSSSDVAVDLTCGPGRFLQAIPQHVTAYGVEIDPEVAQQAAAITGRQIIVSDFREADLPERPTAIVGNPPFKMKLVDQLLDKAHELLPDEGRVGLILPAYAFQTASTIVRYNEHWSISQEMIPRNIYPGLSMPLVFSLFRKDQRRVLVGFSLYYETAMVQSMPSEIANPLVEGPMTWTEVVFNALDELGGEAELKQIYEAVADKRPTDNPFWQAQIRKICQMKTRRTGKGRYQLFKQAA